jgi:hypothetical protein
MRLRTHEESQRHYNHWINVADSEKLNWWELLTSLLNT